MIKFGTGGWRDIIGENFTFDNVRRFSQGVANKIIQEGKEKQGVVIGFDNRFMAEEFAQASAEVFAGNDIQVYLLQPSVPTPLVNYVTKQEGTAVGLTFTASHNPYIYNGIKYVSEGGNPATIDITDALEKMINAIDITEVKKLSYKDALNLGTIERLNYDNEFIEFVESQLNMDKLKKSGLKVLYDPMYGTGINAIFTLLVDIRAQVKIIHDKIDPLFGGRVPAPTEDTLWRLMAMMKEGDYHIGIATDGDGDRIAVVDETGDYVDANEILSILYYYLMAYKKDQGHVVRNISTTHLLDDIAESYGYTCYEKPVGFKHIAEGLIDTNAVLGGESSGGITIRGHLLEKDAVLSAGLLLEMLAETGKTLKELRQEIYQKYGERFYKEYNYEYEPKDIDIIHDTIATIQPEKMYDRVPLSAYKDYDGFKWEWEDGTWCLVRFSGTEPVLRMTAEAKDGTRAEEVIDKLIQIVEKPLSI